MSFQESFLKFVGIDPTQTLMLSAFDYFNSNLVLILIISFRFKYFLLVIEKRFWILFIVLALYKNIITIISRSSSNLKL